MDELNLDLDETEVTREAIDARIKELNATRLTSLADARCKSPSSPRTGSTGCFARSAGTGGISGYDYGVFSFTDLFARALYGKGFDESSEERREEIIGACEWMCRIICLRG